VTRSIYTGAWRVDLDVRPGVRSLLGGAALARDVGAALDAGHAPSPASIGLVLSDDSELSALNAEHMGVTGPTDVLSFPLLPAEAFREGARFPEQPRPPRTRLHLGDIGRGGHTGDVRWSPADELRLLVTHGTLHVCGWDHAEPAEEAEMRALERELLGAG
jgi:probable rRNA maturation factor